MIRRLRLKFVLINMSIVSIMLVVILGLVFYFTSANLERESMRMLENLAVQPVGLGVPGEPGEDVNLPFFKLQLGLGGQVVATGGGVVTRPENRDPMRQNSTVVFLRRGLERLPVEGRPVSQARGLEELYRVRLPLYEGAADLTVDNNGPVEDTVSEIRRRLAL